MEKRYGEQTVENLTVKLWTTVDQLRANSGFKSTEYADTVFGLIFLRFSDVKYSKLEPEFKAESDAINGIRIERPMHEITIEKFGLILLYFQLYVHTYSHLFTKRSAPNLSCRSE